MPSEGSTEMFTKLATQPEGMSECPCCGSKEELWQFIDEDCQSAYRLVACPNSKPIGPQSGLATVGCLLYLPPQDFYRPTVREAVKYWNEFATALKAQRMKNEREIS